MTRYHMLPCWLVFAIAAAVVYPVAARAQLEVEVRPHKASLILGEPLIVSSVVRNNIQEKFELSYQNSPTYDRVGESVILVRIARDVPTFKTWYDGAWFDGFRPRERVEPLTLRPGEEVSCELVVLFNQTGGLAFDKPGKYWIGGSIKIRRGVAVEAEPQPITVLEPESRDQAVWDWISKHDDEYGRLVQIPWMAELPDEFVSECGELARTSDSVYTEYLALFLSRWYGEGPGKDFGEAARFAEIATAKASSGILKTLAARNAERVAKEVQAQVLRERSESEKKKHAEHPVEPGVRKEVEAVFQGFIAALAAGDLERCVELTAEDYRGWSRARQREEFQEETDKLENLRRQGITTEVSTRVLSVVGIGKDVLITAVVSYRRGSKPPEENTVRCHLRKYGDHWLLQDWR